MKKTFLILLSAFMLFACQPTPDEPILIQKDTERLVVEAKHEKLVERNGTLRNTYEIPERCTGEFSFETDRICATVDAAVIMPDVEKIPMVRVKPAQFSQETVRACMKALCRDMPMYDTTSGGYLKYQMEQTIKHLTDAVSESTGDEREEYETMLAYFKEQYLTLPDDPYASPSDGTLREMYFSTYVPKVGVYDGVYCVENPLALEDGEIGATFRAQNDYKSMQYDLIDWGQEVGALIYYSRNLYDSNSTFSSNRTIWIEDKTTVPEFARDSLHITPAEAQEQVQTMLNEIGANLLVSDVYLFASANIDDRQPYLDEDAYLNAAQAFCYMIPIGTNVNGIPARTVTESEGNNDKSEESMAPSWLYERIFCIVDDNGIRSFHWRGPMAITEIVSEDVSLLPFPKIMEIFEQMVRAVYGGKRVDNRYIDTNIRVDRIALELQRVTDPNAIETGIMIPVWNFYGSCIIRYTNLEYDHLDRNGTPASVSLLTINAIDGTVINAQNGY